jgi:hypothetical protein
VSADLAEKMVLVSGPRQSGTTTMARAILRRRHRAFAGRYLNWDDDEARTRVLQREFPRDGLVVFDALRFFRDVEGREVDFVQMVGGKPVRFVECKLTETRISPSLLYLRRKFPAVEAVQVLATAGVDRAGELVSADRFLGELAL